MTVCHNFMGDVMQQKKLLLTRQSPLHVTISLLHLYMYSHSVCVCVWEFICFSFCVSACASKNMCDCKRRPMCAYESYT